MARAFEGVNAGPIGAGREVDIIGAWNKTWSWLHVCRRTVSVRVVLSHARGTTLPPEPATPPLLRLLHAGVVILACVALPASTVAAATWPQFRGPGSDGLAAEGSVPTQWGSDKNIVWKVSLPGFGWSQPVVWGDKIFVTTAVTDQQVRPKGGQAGPGFGILQGLQFGRGLTTGGPPPEVVYRWEVLCIDSGTGQVVWERTAHEGRPAIPIHRSNTYASETPATDGKRLIVIP